MSRRRPRTDAKRVRAKIRAALTEIEARGIELRELASLRTALEILESREDAGGDAGDGHAEVLQSLCEAMEADEPEGVLDAYDSACAALGHEPAVLGDWIERPSELRALERER